LAAAAENWIEGSGVDSWQVDLYESRQRRYLSVGSWRISTVRCRCQGTAS
jgi:hypothetical protein